MFRRAGVEIVVQKPSTRKESARSNVRGKSFHPNPVFIVCSARSGSTLLRYILDSHPILCCPPELHLVSLIDRLKEIYGVTWGTTEDRNIRQQSIDAQIANDVNAIMGKYATLQGKTRWCEKSIHSIDRMDLLTSVFPNAQYICLYRNCCDQVASGIQCLNSDPSLTGRSYGFAPFIARNDSHLMNGLLDYWQEKSSAILRFETNYSAQCIRIHYEELVQNTRLTLKRALAFLGAEWTEDLLTTIFRMDHQQGRGDHKILLANRIHTESVGTGASLDLLRADERILGKVNAVCERLGYARIGQ